MEELLYSDLNIKEVAPDIYHAKFLTPLCVDILRDLCIENNNWSTEKFQHSTRDIYFEETFPEWFELLKAAEANIWQYFTRLLSTSAFEFYTIFAIKYEMEDQRKLTLHHDESYISGSVKLNADYTGAELVFPRQNFSNLEIIPGDLLLWPSQVTHPHKCTPLKSGKKYSLTFWTKELEDN